MNQLDQLLAQNQNHSHTTHSVVMVRPVDFCFNQQTAADNEFQQAVNLHDNTHHFRSLGNITLLALAEFEQTIQCLNQLGIETLILEKQHTKQCLPDAIFPNNWFSSHSNGQIIIYPMKAENRRVEIQTLQLTQRLNQAGYFIKRMADLREDLPDHWQSGDDFLEGTGSIIFHHPSKRLFAALSERCSKNLLARFASRFGYQLTQFQTSSQRGLPVYHTNVLMSCGEDFAVVTQSAILAGDRHRVMRQLYECVNDVMVINQQQMTQGFCGNILQLKSNQQQPVIALSQSAYKHFTPTQRKQLERHGSLAVCKIPTIERIGGGSVRCMLAENFLPKSTDLSRFNLNDTVALKTITKPTVFCSEAH